MAILKRQEPGELGERTACSASACCTCADSNIFPSLRPAGGAGVPSQPFHSWSSLQAEMIGLPYHQQRGRCLSCLPGWKGLIAKTRQGSPSPPGLIPGNVATVLEPDYSYIGLTTAKLSSHQEEESRSHSSLTLQKLNLVQTGILNREGPHSAQ